MSLSETGNNVKPLVLRLRAAPEQRLDLSPLTPGRLAGKSGLEIARLELQTTRRPVCVGDIFDISDGSAQNIVIEGGSERFDCVGDGMDSGAILVNGDVGGRAARQMAGGNLKINGDAGHWAASGMTAGFVEITGNVGDRLGGPLAGEMQGMNGGMVVVRGDAGERAGDRLRRGVMIIEGNAGADTGSRMLAGTLIVSGVSGPRTGYLLRRGTLVVGATQADLGPTFVDSGVQDLVALRLMAAFISESSRSAAQLLRRPLYRFVGDMALLGKGEIFVATRL
jgi:formylmethanofuran dehydrogenase subunit C